MNNQNRIRTASNSPSQYTGGITIKSAQELEAMSKAGAVVGATLTLLKKSVTPGMTTKDLDNIAIGEITRLGAKPAFLGYQGFPASICTSVNEEIVHGIPGNRKLKEGDIVKVDCGATVDGFIGDAAVSIPVGEVSKEASDLMDATRESLNIGIQAAIPGNRIGDIGSAIQKYAENLGYGVVREFVGHGIGRFLHEDPQVPNYGESGKGQLLRTGMCIAIEPMLNIGGWETKILDDQWTVVTKDGSLSSHFEHTLAITEDGPRVFTTNA